MNDRRQQMTALLVSQRFRLAATHGRHEGIGAELMEGVNAAYRAEVVHRRLRVKA
jgi:hypothetical protein